MFSFNMQQTWNINEKLLDTFISPEIRIILSRIYLQDPEPDCNLKCGYENVTGVISF